MLMRKLVECVYCLDFAWKICHGRIYVKGFWIFWTYDAFGFLLIQVLFFFEVKLYVVVVDLHDVVHPVDVKLTGLIVEAMEVLP